MIETAPHPNDHLVFVAAWQENLAGSILPRDFFRYGMADYWRASGQMTRAEKSCVGPRF